ncbi:peptidoglycan recognition protein family protein [Alteribacter natronophilus]|uniref:peptidoglycan recognition protein family protein n=1 Tax=Alteribacter natronophilus TaxID=2583810 RepID=UPI00110ED9FF|nr:N-acetylmuramoyl-L-alanine amidase [Alteribacter natronophilus]TMW73019.1 N-acetylmuramoyl-L-alanine amidase [Alteribacter natronophilus]
MYIRDISAALEKHSTKKYSRRSLRNITSLTIHHSGTEGGSAQSFASYHVNRLGWPGIGYHYVISHDGTIVKTNSADTVSYHAGQANRFSIGICLTGDFTSGKPGYSQWTALKELCRKLSSDFSISDNRILGHREQPGAATICPGFDVAVLRQQLGESLFFRIGKGDRGAGVIRLQKKLMAAGINPGQIDGIFGPLTETALKKFQSSAGIIPDGVYVSTTNEALRAARRTLREQIPMQRGYDVLIVQQTTHVKQDGIFGPQTAASVKGYQRSRRLTPDGIVGSKTWIYIINGWR